MGLIGYLGIVIIVGAITSVIIKEINKTMTKEQIFEKIDDVYSDHDGGVIYLSEDRMNQIKEVIQQAINFIPCCETLKDKK